MFDTSSMLVVLFQRFAILTSAFCGSQTGDHTALPRPREVKASTLSINVKSFSSDKQTWNAARLKCVCTHLLNGNTTNTDLWDNFGGCTCYGKCYFVSLGNSALY